LGVYLGPEEHILQPDKDNPKGYWEHKLLSYLGEDILIRLGGNHIEPPVFPPGWESSPELADLRQRARVIIEDDFSTSKLWGWKDPRNCLLLPFWQQIVKPTHFVICLRNPISVARSLEHRNGTSFEKGINLWLVHMQSALKYTASQRRYFVFYEDVMKDWQKELQRLAEFLGKAKLAEQTAIQKLVQKFIDQELYNHQTSIVDAIDDPHLTFSAKALYFALKLYVGGGQSTEKRKFEPNVGVALQYFGTHAVYAEQTTHRLTNAMQEVRVEANQTIQYLQAQVQALLAQVVERDGKITSIQQTISGKDKELYELIKLVTEQEKQIFSIQQAVSEKDKELSQFTEQVTEQEKQIFSIQQVVSEKDKEFSQFAEQVAEQEKQIFSIQQVVSEKDKELSQFAEQVAEQEKQIFSIQQVVSEKDKELSQFTEQVAGQEKQISDLQQKIITIYNHYIKLVSSKSWILTRPIRILLRTISHHGVTDGDRETLTRELQHVYRRLLWPIKYKIFLRKLFVRITKWSTRSVDLTSVNLQETPIPDNKIISSMQLDAKDQHTMPFWGARAPYGKRRAAILTNMLLDWSNKSTRFGGGERYALELAKLLTELGIEVTFFQPNFEGYQEASYFGFQVKMFPLHDSYGEFHYGACTYFTEQTKEYDHVYYHLPEYASGLLREDGLLTCHGIWFDHNNYPNALFRTQEWFNHLRRAFANPISIINVDTHSMSFVRGLWPELSNRMHYIPNFYDGNVYRPNFTKRDPNQLMILFPRRSQVNRGSRLFPEIVKNIPFDAKIMWIGEGDSEDTAIIKKVSSNDNRVSFDAVDFDEMPNWYQRADIVVIPSVASEGTSLACIEALASGCAVVATNIGGLSDIIRNGFNGLLVDPEPGAISDGINFLIKNNSVRKALQRTAPRSVKPYELHHWRNKWSRIFLDYGWINDNSYNTWRNKIANYSELTSESNRKERWVILTKNAMHGGVESIIREQSKLLNAPVVVCGGNDLPGTCPFEYSRADTPQTLRTIIQQFDVILYHWLPEWAVDVIKECGKFRMEFVHRKDTCDNDKSVPAGIITHSAFLAKYVYEQYGRRCRVVEHPIDTSLFIPSNQTGKYIGAITSYFETKGIDLFLNAWSVIKDEFPDTPVRFYGSGEDLAKLKNLSQELGVNAEFCPPTNTPWRTLHNFKCVVVPSRIEGFPVSVLESLAMNIPVIATDLEGIQEFNSNAIKRGYKAYIQTAHNEEINDLANVIRNTLNQTTDITSREYIKEYFTPQNHCDSVLNSYLEFKALYNRPV
jgi:glycosyltransferase involved in cell wall biosynthesis